MTAKRDAAIRSQDADAPAGARAQFKECGAVDGGFVCGQAAGTCRLEHVAFWDDGFVAHRWPASPDAGTEGPTAYTPKHFQDYAASLGNVADDEACMLALSARERLVDMLLFAADHLHPPSPDLSSLRALSQQLKGAGRTHYDPIPRACFMECAKRLDAALDRLEGKG